MPLYDFTCRECRQPFEKLVRKETEVAAITCPNCSSSRVEKLLSLPAKPVNAPAGVGAACGQGPPCGAPWCQRTG
jgi:putative FmdB family regulatory protein